MLTAALVWGGTHTCLLLLLTVLQLMQAANCLPVSVGWVNGWGQGGCAATGVRGL
jgi:hypothetical protein